MNSVAEIIQVHFNFFEKLFLAENSKWDNIIEASKAATKIYLIIKKEVLITLKNKSTRKSNNTVLISDKRIVC